MKIFSDWYQIFFNDKDDSTLVKPWKWQIKDRKEWYFMKISDLEWVEFYDEQDLNHFRQIAATGGANGYLEVFISNEDGSYGIKLTEGKSCSWVNNNNCNNNNKINEGFWTKIESN